jgi:hypothetical protein
MNQRQAVEYIEHLATNPMAPIELAQAAAKFRECFSEHGEMRESLRQIWRLADEIKPVIEDPSGVV